MNMIVDKVQLLAHWFAFDTEKLCKRMCIYGTTRMAHLLAFGTNNTERLSASTRSGNVGIGAVPEASYAPSLTIGYGGNNITSRGNVDFRILSGADPRCCKH
jgi:hypothetical protein